MKDMVMTEEELGRFHKIRLEDIPELNQDRDPPPGLTKKEAELVRIKCLELYNFERELFRNIKSTNPEILIHIIVDAVVPLFTLHMEYIPSQGKKEILSTFTAMLVSKFRDYLSQDSMK